MLDHMRVISSQYRLQRSLVTSNTDITHDTAYSGCASTYDHRDRASLRTSHGKAHPHEEDVRRFVQRCLNSSRLEARHQLHRHLSATTLKRRMGYIRGILVTTPPCFPQRQLVRKHMRLPTPGRFNWLFLWSCGLSIQVQVAYATSWTTPPASLILRSASLEK
jgi:hypothetical protein